MGEERAWGRRLAKRFGVDANYDEKSFVVTANGQAGFLDHESLKPEKLEADVVALFMRCRRPRGGSIVTYGWTMAEDLLKLGKR